MAKKKKQNQNNQPTYHIEGDIHAQRDVIMHDQFNQYKQIVKKVEHNPAPAEFAGALRQVQQELAQLKAQSELNTALVRNLEFVEVKVLEAEQKATQPEPPANEIKAALTDAKDTIDLVSGSLASAVNLGTLIGNLLLMAGQVFGAS